MDSFVGLEDYDIPCGDFSLPLDFEPVDLLDDVISQTLQDEVPRPSTLQYTGTVTASDNVGMHMCVSPSDLDPSAQFISPVSPVQYPRNVSPHTDHSSHVSPSSTHVSPQSSDHFSHIPTTPVSNRPAALSTFVSPAVENRGSDSLSGLLGSPPPDSPLAKMPYFGDLQNLLLNECREDMLPQSLLLTMTTQPQPDVFMREKNLHNRFTNLEMRYPQDVKQLSGFYRYQAALVETDRFRSLHMQTYAPEYRRDLNLYYDSQLHQIMDRVEQSLTLLENSHKDSAAQRIIKPRPLLSKRAVKIMEQWYDQHTDHPYPIPSEIDSLAVAGEINAEQVKKWFANKRNRSNNTRTLTEIAKKKRQISLQ